MARQDPTFSSDDLIRFYNRNLSSEEKTEVRKYFREVVFGGRNYHQRLVSRLVARTWNYATKQAGDLPVLSFSAGVFREAKNLASEIERLVETELGSRK